MAKFILNDIKRSSKKAKIVLAADNLPEKIIVTHNVLDLSSLNQEVVCFTKKSYHGSSNAQVEITDIISPKKKSKFLYVPNITFRKPKSSIYTEVMRMAFVGLFILFGINLINVYRHGLQVQNTLITSAASGYQEILQAAEKATTLDFDEAQTDFNEAEKIFSDASSLINFLGNDTSPFLKEKTLESANAILEAGKSLSAAGFYFSKGIQNLGQIPELFIQANLELLDGKTASNQSVSLTEKFKNDLKDLDAAVIELQKTQENLAKIDSDLLPSSQVNFKEKLALAKKRIAQLLDLSQKAQAKLPAILKLLGDRYPHRYLILLQNDAEARPTGGFIGSLVTVVLNDGYITKFEMDDVYKFDGQLKEYIPAPDEIAKISKNWRLRDSNFSPDFTISAEKAAWFFQKEKGDSVDTVIAVNQSLLKSLLVETGDLELPSLKAPLNQSNYQLLLSYLIESKIFGEQEPKKIMKELIPAFQKKFFELKNWGNILLIVAKSFDEKQLLFYSRDEDIQNFFEDLNVTGRQKQVKEAEDYLQVITTSIGGNKSDAFIAQHISHHTIIDTDGTMNDELTISRKHNWAEKDLAAWRSELKKFGYSEISETVIDILGRGQNKSMVRVYVPAGAVLRNVVGADLNAVETKYDDILRKTYFSFPMDVNPGNETKITLRYELPQKLKFYPAQTYKLTAQKQPGMVPSQFSKTIITQPSLKVLRSFPTTAAVTAEGKLVYENDLSKDQYLSALISN